MEMRYFVLVKELAVTWKKYKILEDFNYSVNNDGISKIEEEKENYLKLNEDWYNYLTYITIIKQ